MKNEYLKSKNAIACYVLGISYFLMPWVDLKIISFTGLDIPKLINFSESVGQVLNSFSGLQDMSNNVDKLLYLTYLVPLFLFGILYIGYKGNEKYSGEKIACIVLNFLIVAYLFLKMFFLGFSYMGIGIYVAMISSGYLFYTVFTKEEKKGMNESSSEQGNTGFDSNEFDIPPVESTQTSSKQKKRRPHRWIRRVLRLIIVLSIAMLGATLPFHYLVYDAPIQVYLHNPSEFKNWRVFQKDYFTFSNTFITYTDIIVLTDRYENASYLEQQQISQEPLFRELNERGVIAQFEEAYKRLHPLLYKYNK